MKSFQLNKKGAPMQLSERVRRLKPSATLAVSAKAQDLKAQGRHILSLSVGEPDFATPTHIREAAKSAIDAHFTRYTQVPGIPDLRTAAAGYFNKHYGAEASAENIIVGNGGKQCLYNLLIAVLNPGDEALIPAPFWVSYPPMVELAGGLPVIVPSRAEKGFKITPADLEKFRTPKTRRCIINSPSNPTGAAYSAEELDALAAWAVAAKVLIISDEIYDRLVYPPAKPTSLAGWWKKHPENFVVMNGVSKSFAMTGWRVGYLLGHPDLIKACSKIQGQSTSSVCSVSQKAAVAALTGGMDTVEEMRKAFLRRRDLLMDMLSAWPGVVCPKPQGAFYAFPDVHALYNAGMPNSSAMCARLLEEAGVALVPGLDFGDDNCVRISYAVSDETLIEALDKVGKVLIKR